jgi:hypothetical protein
MKRLKKVLRLCGLILFLILAGIGISVTGAAQVPPKRGGRDNNNEILIEMVEKEKGEKNTPGDEVF